MIGLDTNVVVRYLTKDDPLQTAAAIKLINSLSPEAPGFLSLVVIAELVWVLETSYRFTKTEIDQVLEALLRTRELIVERAEVVGLALRVFRMASADFSDCLIDRLGDASRCQYTVTFDKHAVSAGMRLLR